MKIRPIVTCYNIELTAYEVRCIQHQVESFKGNGNPLYYSNEIGKLINLVNNIKLNEDLKDNEVI